MQTKIIASILCLVVLASTPAVFAQQYSQYGNMPKDEYKTTNQDVASRTLDALISFFASVLKIGNSQDHHLQQIMKNQQTEIQLLQKLDSDLCKTQTLKC